MNRCLCVSTIFDITHTCAQSFYPLYENARIARSTRREQRRIFIQVPHPSSIASIIQLIIRF